MTENHSGNYDPRKAIWNDIPIDEWEPKDYKQWKPKHTGGIHYTAIVEREYLRMRYAVQQANERLSAAKVRVKLKLTSHTSIGLQGTFPCKPGDVGKNGSPNKQYTISLRLPAHDNGLKMAEAKAKELDALVTTNHFKWTPELLGKQAQKLAVPEASNTVKHVDELIEEFEKEFWKTRDRKNRKDITNWQKNYLKYFKRFPSNVPLSNKVLIQVIETSRPNTPTRKQMIEVLKRFCKFADFDDSEIVKYRVVGKLERKRRVPPTDEQVVLGFDKVNQTPDSRTSHNATKPEQWRWAYGMLATYGLRPHELWAVDLEHFTDPSNTLHFVKLNPELTEGTKTGERDCGIPPLHPEWVQLFDLKNPKPITSNACLLAKTSMIGRRFVKVDMGFHPYDLRHAYAIRGHSLGLQLKVMADFMGHTVREHTETYQKWMNENVNKEIYEKVVLGKQIPNEEVTKSKLAELKNENASLKAENESLKALLARYRLEGLLNY